MSYQTPLREQDTLASRLYVVSKADTAWLEANPSGVQYRSLWQSPRTRTKMVQFQAGFLRPFRPRNAQFCWLQKTRIPNLPCTRLAAPKREPNRHRIRLPSALYVVNYQR